jgi:hypothetical protein
MSYAVVFAVDLWLDLERSPRERLERVLLRRGSRRNAQLRPHVVEGPTGPVEVADLFFADGTVARDVPFAAFAFAEETDAAARGG